MAVFNSSLPRTNLQVENNLYDIVRNVSRASVVPLSSCNEKSDCVEFQHKADKFFEPKTKSRLKVRTIRDIRKEYEKYVYTYLKDDLEKQKSYLFKKIESGSAGEDDTVNIARKILQSDQPKLRSTWFMIMKVNPLRKRHSIQFAFWNGINIRLSGSKGGSDKFKWKYDVSQSKKSLKRITRYRHHKQNYLLKSSIFCNFKPGPKSKKNILDKSYQKWTIGEASSVELPYASLVIEPKYNSALDSSILRCVEDLPDENGHLNENWINFALSALGRSIRGSATHTTENSNFSFQLKFKNEQRLLLTRRDDNTFGHNYVTECSGKQIESQEIDDKEIAAIVEKLVCATEISVSQDDLFVEDEKEFNEVNVVESGAPKYSQLEGVNSQFPICRNKFCYLGCICDALNYKYTKEHCGMLGCIFQCMCAVEKNRNNEVEYDDAFVSKSKNNTTFDHFKKKDKFESIDENNIKKLRRRKRLPSKTYSNFYSQFKSQNNATVKEVSVKLTRLNCDNIETWCMVHNLYNCFCKGKIVESVLDEEYPTVLNNSENNNLFSEFKADSLFESDKLDKPVIHYKDSIRKINVSTSKTKNKKIVENEETGTTRMFDHNLCSRNDDDGHFERNVNNIECSETDVVALEDKTGVKKNVRASRFQNKSKSENEETNLVQVKDKKLDDTNLPCSETSMRCARARPFKRRYKDDYYFTKNKKISDMERNDVSLQKKLHTYFVKSLSPECSETERTLDENDHSFSKIIEPPLDPENLTEQPHKLIKNKAALVSWLEAHYKRHKEKLESGSKIILEPPKPGKLALYPWEVLLERYREKKNFFLISRKPQHRIFIAVDCNNKFFKDCINIDEIRYSDLNKYPDTVKNLLTNTVNVKDTFYLLFGLPFCWELYGNVIKSKDTGKIQSFQTNSEDENSQIRENSQQKIFVRRDLNVSASDEKGNNDVCLVITNNNGTDIIENSPQKPSDNKSKETDGLIPDKSDTKPFSRWFFMTIEDDFDELQFVEKGFFVKHESIIKAIEVARSMKKTVRLSGLKCKGENNNPQFGIYALSDMEKLCVFVGPYDENEKLGMETIKGQRTYTSTKKTRGSWLITKKIDNFKVIQNPLSFLPQIKSNVNQNRSDDYENTSKKELTQSKSVEENVRETSDVIVIDKETIENEHNKLFTPTSQLNISSEKKLKIIKPITIRKSDELLQIKNGPVSLLKNVSSVKPKIIISKNPMKSKIYVSKNQLMKPFFATVSKNTLSNRSLLLPKMNTERGMLILKPEEINKRLAENKLVYCKDQLPEECSKNNETPNLESFIAENKALKITDSCADDVMIISDDEDDCIDFEPEKWKDVWIEIGNIPNFGYFRGKKNEKGEISFQFPGFKFSEFYNEKEAFQTINKVLSRKVYLPKSLHLKWSVHESINELKSKKLLTEEDFAPDLIMTPEGLITKAEKKLKIQEHFGNSYAELRAAVFYVTNKEVETVDKLTNEAETIINDLEAKSKKLENTRNSLQEEVSTKKKKIIDISSFLSEDMQRLVKNNLELMDF